MVKNLKVLKHIPMKLIEYVLNVILLIVMNVLDPQKLNVLLVNLVNFISKVDVLIMPVNVLLEVMVIIQHMLVLHVLKNVSYVKMELIPIVVNVKLDII